MQTLLTAIDAVLAARGKAGLRALRQARRSFNGQTGHNPMAVVEVSGGNIHAAYSDDEVKVVVVDWDTEGLSKDDLDNNPSLFALRGDTPLSTIGRSYVAEMHGLNSMETDTEFAVENALCNKGEQLPKDD